MIQLLHHIIQQFVNNMFLNAAVIGGVLLGILNYFKKVPSRIYEYVKGKFITSITIDSKSDLFFWLNTTIEQMPFHNHRRSFYIFGKENYSGRNRGFVTPSAMGGEENEGLFSNTNFAKDKGSQYKTEKETTHTNTKMYGGDSRALEYVYTPAPGGYIFRYKKRWLYIHLDRETKNSGNPLFTVTISYFGRDKKFFDDLMDQAEATYQDYYKDKTTLYTNTGYGDWVDSKVSPLLKRPVDSVVLREGQADKIISSIEEFRSSEKKYTNLGIPYHNTLLFYGPPGTGKTSFIYAVANHFNLSLFYLNLQIVTDEKIVDLFKDIKDNSLLVIEDLGNLYDQEKFVVDRGINLTPPSFNLLINCLDGFLSRHGALTILTTNHFDRVSPTLMRHGRIDEKYYFGRCDEYQVTEMMNRYYKYMKVSVSDYTQRIQKALPNFLQPGKEIVPSTLQKFLLDDTTKTIDEYVKYLEDFTTRNINA